MTKKRLLAAALATTLVITNVVHTGVLIAMADTKEDSAQELSLQNDSLSTATDKIGEVKVSKIGYQMAELWYDDVFVVKQNDKCGAVDIDGNIVVPIEYDYYIWANSDKTEVCFGVDESKTIVSQTWTYQNRTVYRYTGEKVVSYINKSNPLFGNIEHYAYGDGILGNIEEYVNEQAKQRVIDTCTGEVLYSPKEQATINDSVNLLGQDDINGGVCAATEKEYYRFQNGEVVKYDFPWTLGSSFNNSFIADDVIYSPESNRIYYVATGEEFSFPDNCNKESITYLQFGRDGYYALMDNDTQTYNIYHKGEVVSETNLTWITFNNNSSRCIVGGNDTTAYVLDYQGKIKYTAVDISEFRNGKAVVYDGTGVFYIDENGNKLSDYIVYGDNLKAVIGSYGKDGMYYPIYIDDTKKTEHVHSWESQPSVIVEETDINRGLKAVRCKECNAIKDGCMLPENGVTYKCSNGILNVEGTGRIEPFMFYWNDFTEINIGSGITEIGASAFRSCTAKTVRIAEGVKKIGPDAFYDSIIEKIYIPDSVEEISEYSVLYAKTIYASSNSYAIKYAKAKNIPYVETDAITIKVNTKFTKTASSKAQTFKLNAKAENASLTYSSDNKSVKVDKNGKVTIPKNYSGKAVITIKATSGNLKAVTKKVTITVNPAAVKLTSAKNTASNKTTIKWSKLSYVSGYEVQYSTNSNFKGAKSVKVNKASASQQVISRLVKGKTYYVRVRAYKTYSKTSIWGSWSAKKSVKISK